MVSFSAVPRENRSNFVSICTRLVQILLRSAVGVRGPNSPLEAGGKLFEVSDC